MCPKSEEKISSKSGWPPGTPVSIGSNRENRSSVYLMEYNENFCEESRIAESFELDLIKAGEKVRWIHVEGTNDVETVTKVANNFGIHALHIEDIVNRSHRPKFEEDDAYLFVVSKVPSDTLTGLSLEQSSIILCNDTVLTFSDTNRPADVLKRIYSGTGRIRKKGADYLVYVLLDTIVDSYFSVLERIGRTLEDIEDEIFSDSSQEYVQQLHNLRQEVVLLRRTIWPMREVLATILNRESEKIEEGTIKYFRDIYDHLVHILESIEGFRDLVSGLFELHVSFISNKMNETMKILTVIATIFIPLTLIAGIYGMNFKYMPELDWKWGYFVTLAVMFSLGAVMILYFKKKEWV